jgi:ribonuclease T1
MPQRIPPNVVRAAFVALLLLLIAGIGDRMAQPSLSPARQALELIQSNGPSPFGRFPAEEQGAILMTLTEINTHGPFPYRQDGAVFFDREGLLPAEPTGFYHEYTVPTPGDPSRGTRRLVLGAGGELYFTDDHYRSFYRLH